MTDKEDKNNIGFAGIGTRISDLEKESIRKGSESTEEIIEKDETEIRAAKAKRERDIAAIRAREKAKKHEKSQTKSEEEDSEWESRKLCSDETCIGVIGPNGYCTECGKPHIMEEDVGDKHEIVNCPKCDIRLRLLSVSKSLKVKCPNCDFSFVWDNKGKISSEKISTSSAGKETKVNKKAIFVVTLIVAFIGALIYVSNDSQKESSSQVRQRPLSNIDPSTFQKSSRNPPVVIEKKDKFELTKESFSELYNDTGRVKQIQRFLYVLGYPVGSVDGIAGSKTYAAFVQFIEDFQLRPHGNIGIELLSSLKRCATIAEVQPDFKKLIVTGELDLWIDTQPYDSKKIYRRLRDFGEPRKVVLMIDRLKFFKENPPAIDCPSTGCIDTNFFKGVAPFTIKTRHSGYNFYIKLVDRSDREPILLGFIRSGETLTTKVPLGKYDLKYATGKNWYGKRYLFGPNTMYSQADKILHFYESGDYVYGLTIELYLQPDGNLTTKGISGFDF